jgi:amino acid transporter
MAVYAIILTIKIVLYVQIVSYVDQLTLTPSGESHFGMFMGNVLTTNKGVAILATLIIIVLICLCFYLSYISIKYLEEVGQIAHTLKRLCDDRQAFNLLSQSHDFNKFKSSPLL